MAERLPIVVGVLLALVFLALPAALVGYFFGWQSGVVLWFLVALFGFLNLRRKRAAKD